MFVSVENGNGREGGNGVRFVGTISSSSFFFLFRQQKVKKKDFCKVDYYY